jgi:hypothetical protein
VGRTYEQISPALAAFIEEQHLFFVGSAPSEGGHVNVSPKGQDSLRILDDRRVAYLDLTGSGIETIAHVRQNGRLTIMFCAFDGPPRIVRLQGTASVVTVGEDAFAELAAGFPPNRGARAVIVLEVDRIADSCGYTVPRFDFVADRDRLDRWAEARTDDELRAYRVERNAHSIDGAPGWRPEDDRAG